jgi:hypothetical protein
LEEWGGKNKLAKAILNNFKKDRDFHKRRSFKPFLKKTYCIASFQLDWKGFGPKPSRRQATAK